MSQIKLNGRDVSVDSPVTYEQLIKIADRKGRPTVTYYSPTSKYGCELVPGDYVHVISGDVINIAVTGRV